MMDLNWFFYRRNVWALKIYATTSIKYILINMVLCSKYFPTQKLIQYINSSSNDKYQYGSVFNKRFDNGEIRL